MKKIKELIGDKYREGMTLEEVEAEMQELDLVDASTIEESVSKATFDKTASDLAKAKKELKEKKTQEELEADEVKDLKESIAKYEENEKASKIREGLIGSGYSIEEAENVSKSILGGDIDSVVATLGESRTNLTNVHEKEIKKIQLETTVRPGAGQVGDDGAMNQETFKGLGVEERTKLKNEQPDIYEKFKNKEG